MPHPASMSHDVGGMMSQENAREKNQDWKQNKEKEILKCLEKHHQIFGYILAFVN